MLVAWPYPISKGRGTDTVTAFEGDGAGPAGACAGALIAAQASAAEPVTTANQRINVCSRLLTSIFQSTGSAHASGLGRLSSWTLRSADRFRAAYDRSSGRDLLCGKGGFTVSD